MIDYIREHIKAYPHLEYQDIVKLCYQSAMGAEHILQDKEAARKYFDAEYNGISPRRGELIRMISPDFCRVDMSVWKGMGLCPHWLFQLFCLSAVPAEGGGETLVRYLRQAAQLVEGFGDYAETYIKSGGGAVHHSEGYRRHYDPHYRLVARKYLGVIPILSQLTKIDCDDENSTNAKVLVIEGRAAAGKSTMAELLSIVTGAPVVHMDDFFLPPALRTEQRLAEAGGNIHYERFAEEVLTNLKSGEGFSYQRFDCSKMAMGEMVHIAKSPLVIVEGVYSLHPKLGDYADVVVFMDITEEEQASRIIRRNGNQMAQRFFSLWIPMEEKYFKSLILPENIIRI